MLHPLAARNGFCFVLTCFALTMTIPSASQTSGSDQPRSASPSDVLWTVTVNLLRRSSAPPRLRVCSLFSL